MTKSESPGTICFDNKNAPMLCGCNCMMTCSPPQKTQEPHHLFVAKINSNFTQKNSIWSVSLLFCLLTISHVFWKFVISFWSRPETRCLSGSALLITFSTCLVCNRKSKTNVFKLRTCKFIFLYSGRLTFWSLQPFPFFSLKKCSLSAKRRAAFVFLSCFCVFNLKQKGCTLQESTHCSSKSLSSFLLK